RCPVDQLHRQILHESCTQRAYSLAMFHGPTRSCARCDPPLPRSRTAYRPCMPRVGGRILPALTDNDASAHRARISAALYQTFASQLHLLIDRLDNL
ncbi:MAG: hypothetical protein O7G88_20320, partial [bacterium]|nr:hypothetical protein [bacterium]